MKQQQQQQLDRGQDIRINVGRQIPALPPRPRSVDLTDDRENVMKPFGHVPNSFVEHSDRTVNEEREALERKEIFDRYYHSPAVLQMREKAEFLVPIVDPKAKFNTNSDGTRYPPESTKVETQAVNIGKMKMIAARHAEAKKNYEAEKELERQRLHAAKWQRRRDLFKCCFKSKDLVKKVSNENLHLDAQKFCLIVFTLIVIAFVVGMIWLLFGFIDSPPGLTNQNSPSLDSLP